MFKMNVINNGQDTFKIDNSSIKNFGRKPIKIFSTFYDLLIDLLPEKNKYW